MESRTISNGRRDVRECPPSLRSKQVRALTLLVLTFDEVSRFTCALTRVKTFIFSQANVWLDVRTQVHA